MPTGTRCMPALQVASSHACQSVPVRRAIAAAVWCGRTAPRGALRHRPDRSPRLASRAAAAKLQGWRARLVWRQSREPFAGFGSRMPRSYIRADRRCRLRRGGTMVAAEPLGSSRSDTVPRAPLILRFSVAFSAALPPK